jgi:hypothetical protein
MKEGWREIERGDKEDREGEREREREKGGRSSVS